MNWANCVAELKNLMELPLDFYIELLDTPRKFAKRLREKAIEKGILPKDR